MDSLHPTTELNGNQLLLMKEFLFRLMDERDMRYQQRMDGVEGRLLEAQTRIENQQLLFVTKGTMEAALSAFDKAVAKSEISYDKRFEAVNEFRAQLADQQINLVRKTEVDIQFKNMHDKLEFLLSKEQVSQGKETGISTTWGTIAGVLAFMISATGLIIALVAMFAHK